MLLSVYFKVKMALEAMCEVVDDNNNYLAEGIPAGDSAGKVKLQQDGRRKDVVNQVQLRIVLAGCLISIMAGWMLFYAHFSYVEGQYAAFFISGKKMLLQKLVLFNPIFQ